MGGGASTKKKGDDKRVHVKGKHGSHVDIAEDLYEPPALFKAAGVSGRRRSRVEKMALLADVLDVPVRDVEHAIARFGQLEQDGKVGLTLSEIESYTTKLSESSARAAAALTGPTYEHPTRLVPRVWKHGVAQASQRRQERHAAKSSRRSTAPRAPSDERVTYDDFVTAVAPFMGSSPSIKERLTVCFYVLSGGEPRFQLDTLRRVWTEMAQHQVLSTGQSVPVEQLNPDDPAHAAFIMLFRDKHPEYGRSISLKQFLKHLLPLVENMSKQEQEDLLGIPWSKPKQHTGEDEAE